MVDFLLNHRDLNLTFTRSSLDYVPIDCLYGVKGFMLYKYMTLTCELIDFGEWSERFSIYFNVGLLCRSIEVYF